MEQPKLVILLLFMHTVTGINDMKCNGLEGLCDLKIDQVTFPGAHNATVLLAHVCGAIKLLTWVSSLLMAYDTLILIFVGKVKNCHCSSVSCNRGTDIQS